MARDTMPVRGAAFAKFRNQPNSPNGQNLTDQVDKSVSNASSEPTQDFCFITVANPTGSEDRSTRRRARSHAVKRGIQTKRRLQQESGANFCVSTSGAGCHATRQHEAHKSLVPRPISSSTSVYSKAAFEPVKLFLAGSSAFEAWLARCTSSDAAASVFSISDELVLPNFRAVFTTRLDDPALLYAAMLTFSTATADIADQENLAYHTQALTHLRERMTSAKMAASESTLGAILLLAGLEARRGMSLQAQLHMNAVLQLLDLCRTHDVPLTDGIKRAIFWQDLHSSTMTGYHRIVGHTTFAEMQWTRDHFMPNAFTLAPGFQSISHLLTPQFIELLKDIHAFQYIRAVELPTAAGALPMARIDNHQASIQSRLADGAPTTSPLEDCCRSAAYLCTAVLRCRVWEHSSVPAQLSLRLLHRMQHHVGNPIWGDHPGVLAWLLHVGGAFAPEGTLREEYIMLLRSALTCTLADLYESWEKLLSILKQFIWADKAFATRVRAFHEQVARTSYEPL